MSLVEERREELSQSIETLYRVFGRYRFTDTLGDAAFPGFCDSAPMLSVPLNQVPAEALDLFHAKAMTTWGSTKDFRHFLPRLLELSVENRFTFDREVLWGKLDYGGWRKWPRKEIDAIEQFSLAFWKFALVSPCESDDVTVGGLDICDLVLAFAKANGGLRIYLDQWREDICFEDTEVMSAIHLGYCVDRFALTSKKHLNWDYSDTIAADEFLSWLMAIRPHELIESIFHRHADGPHSDQLSRAHEFAEWFWKTQGRDC